MMLVELQRRVAAAIMAPLTGSGRIAKQAAPGVSMRAEADALIKPNARLTAMERLEIYSRSYWFRVLDSLREDFPGVCAVVGQRAWDRLARAYVSEVGSRSFTMRNLGSRLEQWLRDRPVFAGKNPELAFDMARLEWAHIEAYDGEQQKSLGPEDLLEAGAEMRFGLQPHISLLRLSYPVDDLRIRVEELAADRGEASNTIVRRRERAAVKRYKTVDPQATFLAIHRVEFSVYYKRLAREEFLVLEALRNGAQLGEMLGDVTASNVEGWFATWSRLGWLCRPERREN